MLECAKICLNGFCFTFPHCNSLSKETIYHFLGKWIFFLSIVAGGIWFVYCFRLDTFTSKISDFLSPFGAARAGGRESYPPDDITNKYIHDFLFINDLFIYFTVVVFQLLGTSEELIRDSQRLWFCNSVRL